TPLSLSGFSQTLGTPSAEQSFNVSAINLTADMDFTAPTGYEISFESGIGFAANLTLTPSAGVIADTTVYVRLNAASAGNYDDHVTIASTGASDALVSVSGTAQGEGTTALIYYWHFNNLNTSSGDVTEIEADFSL